MDSVNFDLASASVTDVNGFLHREAAKAGTRRVLISNPDGAHNIAVGLDLPIEIEIDGHALSIERWRCRGLSMSSGFRRS